MKSEFSSECLLSVTFMCAKISGTISLALHTLESSLTSMGLLSGVYFLWISIGLFCIQYQYFLPTGGASSEVVFEFEMKSNLFRFIKGQLIWAPLGMPKWVWPSKTRYRMLLVQTSTLPSSKHITQIWKVFYTKQWTPWSQVMSSWRITLLPQKFWKVPTWHK
jgi:hypothetical protein